jgi:carotenoid cleavage dioxygenase-like enzyme
MAGFPASPWFSGVNASSRAEVDIENLEVIGTIPPEIDGAFYRVAADHQFPPKFADDIPFNGDGMISVFRFRQGKVDLKSRYVRTQRWHAERNAGRALFGKYRNRHLDDPTVKGMPRDLANTNVLIHGGVLLAFWEGARAVALDPVTLETLGRWNFHGTFNAPTCSAHCAIDPVSGNLVGFAFAAKGEFTTDTMYFEVSPEGKVIHEAWFHLPYFAELHDCGVTKDYICFPVVPIMGCGEDRLKQGETYYGWDPNREIQLGVLPRFGRGDQIRWFKAPNQFTSHKMNAWNEGSKIFFDTCVSPGNLFPWFPEWGKPYDPSKAAVKLTRWTVDYAQPGDGFESSRVLSDYIGEFPRVDHRYLLRKYRHGWMLGFAGPRRGDMAHVDLELGTTTVWEAPRNKLIQEPCFIPRSANAPEGVGWIAQAATDTDTTLTELNLFEATNIGKGPIATIRTPVHLKPAYHGNWFDVAEINARRNKAGG